METFTVYDGSAQPKRARGSRQVRIAQFAQQNRCWHYRPTARNYLRPKDAKADRRAVRALAARDVLEIEGPCYRWKGGAA